MLAVKPDTGLEGYDGASDTITSGIQPQVHSPSIRRVRTNRSAARGWSSSRPIRWRAGTDAGSLSIAVAPDPTKMPRSRTTRPYSLLDRISSRSSPWL